MPNQSSVSFEDIAVKFSNQLYAYLVKITGNRADADDILQEALIRIANGLPDFNFGSSVKTWVYRIATNAAIDNLRKKKVPFIEFDETLHSEIDDESDIIVLDEMNECVKNMIYKLPPDYRSAIILFNIEGKSIEETADICSISISTAKIRIHRAKGKLREALNKKCDFYKSHNGNLRCDER